MLNEFFFTGIAAAILCAVVVLVTESNHQLTLDIPAVFALVISALAAILGATVALIYHLSHLHGIHHTVQHYSEAHAAQRQQARLQ
jgi:hypothetical protein